VRYLASLNRARLGAVYSNDRDCLAAKCHEFDFKCLSITIHMDDSANVTGRQIVFLDIGRENDSVVFLDHIQRLYNRHDGIGNSRPAAPPPEPSMPPAEIRTGRRTPLCCARSDV
jgi:hypothetical protein